MVGVVADFVEVTPCDVSANINLNINSNWVRAEVAQGAVGEKRGVELVLDASVHGVGEVDMSRSGDFAMNLSEELSGCGVSKNCVGAGCCPTDSLCPSGVRTGRAGRVRSAGWVHEALWARMLRGRVHITLQVCPL
jgi:hypothetical protein